MNFELKLLLSMSLLYNFGEGFFSPIYALFVKNIGGSIIDVGIAWSIFSISMGIMLILFGKLENRKFDKKLMIFLGYLFISFCTLGYIFIQTPLQLFILQLFLGLSIAMLNPAFMAYFGMNEDKGDETGEWGYWDGGKRIAMGISAIIGSFIVYTFSWTLLFIIMFVFQFSAALLALNVYLRKT